MRECSSGEAGSMELARSMEIINKIVEEWTLHDNPEQERAFTIVAEHILQKDLQQLLMFITGIGGSGKTHVIKAILDVFVKSGRYQEILVSAPTGSAACLIDGYTIHALTLMGVGTSSNVCCAPDGDFDGNSGKQKINVGELQEI